MLLDNHTKELIAIGASISANCIPCLEYHIDKAKETGANELEIKEAIEVGKLVRRGAAAKIDKFALTLSTGIETVTNSENKECGCSK